MSVPVFMDVHVHRAITEGLRLRDVDVLTAQEDGAARLPDPDLLQRATDLGRPLLTYDDDLLDIAADWQGTGRSFAGLLFINSQDVAIGWCVLELETLLQAGEPADFENIVMYLSHPTAMRPAR